MGLREQDRRRVHARRHFLDGLGYLQVLDDGVLWDFAGVWEFLLCGGQDS